MRHRTVKTVYREAKSGTTRAYKYPLEVNMRTLFSGLLPQSYHAPVFFGLKGKTMWAWYGKLYKCCQCKTATIPLT
jgi:hypothetical protein